MKPLTWKRFKIKKGKYGEVMDLMYGFYYVATITKDGSLDRPGAISSALGFKLDKHSRIKIKKYRRGT